MDPEKHTLLLYEYVDDIIERRGPYRDAHLALLQQLKDSGTVLACFPALEASLGATLTGLPYLGATASAARGHPQGASLASAGRVAGMRGGLAP